MNTKMLLKEFRNILDLEKKAKHLYDRYIGQVDDQEIKDQLISIRDDETRHVGTAEALIKLVS